MKQIGKSLKKHRMAKGMTQDQLAEQLSVTRQAISNWETGKTQPGIETITALAAVFGITVEELINSSPPAACIHCRWEYESRRDIRRSVSDDHDGVPSGRSRTVHQWLEIGRAHV